MLNTIIYLFPKYGEQLTASMTIESVKSLGLKFKPNYFMLVPREEANGHLVDDPEKEFKVNSSFIYNEFHSLLEQSKDIEITSDLINIKYAINDLNPNISISWSRKWYHFLDEKTKEDYLNIILDFANLSGSSYVIFLEDLFDKYDDRFEDRFLFIDEKVIIDDSPKKKSQWEFMIDEIWKKEGLNLAVKSGKILVPIKDLDKEFTSYRLI